jgi:NAD(P)-dependent dehydrogenase (short-subunit alcohol dehydrogenase family)
VNTLDLAGRRIAVTGGLGALGLATAAVLAGRGAHVALLDRASATDATDATSAAAVLGGVDLSDESAARDAFGRAAAALGGLDGLVNVAGGFAWETLEQGQVQTWDRLYAMNLRTAVVASTAALPHLLAGGESSIVNVGAQAAARAGTGMAAYAASKAGVARLTESMAEEFKDRGLRVNAVLPSILDTPANRRDMPEADTSRWVAPQALARVIAFLLSTDAQPVTGACLPVTGRV